MSAHTCIQGNQRAGRILKAGGADHMRVQGNLGSGGRGVSALRVVCADRGSLFPASLHPGRRRDPSPAASGPHRRRQPRSSLAGGPCHPSCLVLAWLVLALAASDALAGNGIFQTGYGLAGRGMGGAATGMPLSPIDAVAFNPAGLTRFRGFTFDSATTLTDNPTVNGTVTSEAMGINLTGHLQHGLFMLPASALTYQSGRLVGGFGAIAYAGSGSDWRNTDLKDFFRKAPPYNSDISAYVGIIRLSPALAVRVLEWLSLGASLDVNLVQADLGYGMGLDACVGFSAGALLAPLPWLSLGASYTNESGTRAGRVLFVPDSTSGDRGTGNYQSVEVRSPQAVRAGVALTPLENLILAFDYKWYNYARSHESQDWQNVNVYSVGAQYRIRGRVALRAGYTWHGQPVREHGGWDPADPTAVFAEYFRTLSTPLSMRENFTCGLGVNIKNFEVNIAYEKTFRSQSRSTSAGRVLQYAVEFDQDHYSFGFTIRY